MRFSFSVWPWLCMSLYFYAYICAWYQMIVLAKLMSSLWNGRLRAICQLWKYLLMLQAKGTKWINTKKLWWNFCLFLVLVLLSNLISGGLWMLCRGGRGPISFEVLVSGKSILRILNLDINFYWTQWWTKGKKKIVWDQSYTDKLKYPCSTNPIKWANTLKQFAWLSFMSHNRTISRILYRS